MIKLSCIFFLVLCSKALQAQTMYVRSVSGPQTSYPVANIQKLTFENGNLIVTNDTGPNGTFALAENRYINFTDLTLGTSNPVAAENKYYVYPNPSSRWLHIACTNSLQVPISIEIISLEGRLLMKHQPEAESVQLDVSILPPGLYLCRISSNANQTQVLKFLKQ